MNQGPTEISDKVTVMVFKDNYTARTFQVPLNWISRFGLTLGILVCLATLSTLAAVKYYRIVLKTDPVRVQDLEQELADLKSTLKEQEAKVEKHEPKPPEPSISKEADARAAHTLSLSGFPEGVEDHLPPPSSLPFTLQSPRAFWEGKILKVRMALQYTRNDRGNQQGRIVITARGPGYLLSSPTAVINPVGSDHLFEPDKGEFFSVSRFREVKADFGPMPSRDSIQEVEVYIFDDNIQLLAYQKISPHREARAEPKQAPAEPSETPIEPTPSEPIQKDDHP